MQLLDSTAKGLGVKNSYNPEENIEGGIKHLKSLLKHYKGDVPKTVAAYNMGEGALDQFLKKYGSLEASLDKGTFRTDKEGKKIPFPDETRGYIKAVMKNLNQLENSKTTSISNTEKNSSKVEKTNKETTSNKISDKEKSEKITVKPKEVDKKTTDKATIPVNLTEERLKKRLESFEGTKEVKLPTYFLKKEEPKQIKEVLKEAKKEKETIINQTINSKNKNESKETQKSLTIGRVEFNFPGGINITSKGKAEIRKTLEHETIISPQSTGSN